MIILVSQYSHHPLCMFLHSDNMLMVMLYNAYLTDIEITHISVNHVTMSKPANHNTGFLNDVWLTYIIRIVLLL